jgi:hypothetical protein
MIVFDLECRGAGHRFEGWFGSSDDFAHQQERGLVECPVCGSSDVTKAVMAPNVGRKGNQIAAAAPAAKPNARAVAMAGGGQAIPSLPPEAVAVFQAIATAQAEALKSSRWVGSDFAENARAMHYGETEAEAIHGQTSPEEARELIDEGIEVSPILFPVAPPKEAN